MFALIILAELTAVITARIIRALQAQAVITNAINVRRRRAGRTGLQKLEYLSEHYANIIRICFIYITNSRTSQLPPNSITLEHLEVKVLTVQNRAVFVIIKTIIATFFITVVPMRTACLTAYTTQAPIARARNIIGYHCLNTSLLVILTILPSSSAADETV